MDTMPEFAYSELLPLGPDDTPYRLLTSEGVRTFEAAGRTFLQVEPEALTLLTARGDARHRAPAAARRTSRSCARILDDPEASPNDRFVALELLKNANIAAGGVLPMCQDTGTAIVMGKKGQHVLTGGGDEEAIAARRLRHLHRARTCATRSWRRSTCTRRRTPAPTCRRRSSSTRPTATPTSSCSWPRAAARPTRATCSRRPRRC